MEHEMTKKHQRLTCQILQKLSDRVLPRSAIEEFASRFNETAEKADAWEEHEPAFESLRTTFMGWLVSVKGMDPDRASNIHQDKEYTKLLIEFDIWVASRF